MSLRLFAVLGITLIAFGIGFVVAKHRGDQTRRAITACHARGPQYHYWQDRDRCVLYVGP